VNLYLAYFILWTIVTVLLAALVGTNSMTLKESIVAALAIELTIVFVGATTWLVSVAVETIFN
jgi:hypothetical protein